MWTQHEPSLLFAAKSNSGKITCDRQTGKEARRDHLEVKPSSVSWQHLSSINWLTVQNCVITFPTWHASVLQITSISSYICFSAWSVSSAKCERDELMVMCNNQRGKSGLEICVFNFWSKHVSLKWTVYLACGKTGCSLISETQKMRRIL